MKNTRDVGKIFLLALLALSLVFVPSAFAKKSKKAAKSQEPIKIGAIFSVTGKASFLGDPEKKSMEMVAEIVNKQGGIDGRMIETFIYDDEGDPTKAVSFATKLMEKDKVAVIIGPSLTPTTMAIKPLTEKANMPLISCAAGNEITLPATPYVFKTAQSDILAVAAIYKHMQAKGIKKIAILCVDDGFGQSGREQLINQAPTFGLSVVSDEKYGKDDTDMTAQLTKASGATPEALVCWGTNPGPAVVAKNFKTRQMGIPLYMSHGVASPKFLELAGDAAEGIILPSGALLIANSLPDTNPQKAVLLGFAKDFKAKYEAGPSPFGGYAYDAMNILAKALPGTGGDKAKLRDNIENLKGFVGVSGTFNFTKEDHNGLGDDAFVMVEIKNKTWNMLQ